jgi:hypothetical protein
MTLIGPCIIIYSYSKTNYIAKTKYMSVGTDTNHLEMDNGDIITGCTKFRYLGTIFTKDGRDTKNICHIVTQAWKLIGALTFKSLAVSLRTTRFNIQNFYMVLALR